jgi:hypothetical protein
MSDLIKDKPYEIEQTFFSDGTRIITVKYKSYEGERIVIKAIEAMIKRFVKYRSVK